MAKVKDKTREILNIPANQISSPKNRARITFNKEKLEELKISINENGLIHPIRVKTIRGGFEVIAGERRFLAMTQLGWNKIPVEIFKGTMIENEMIKVHENLKRDDLSDIEEAHFIKRLLKLTKEKPRQIAKRIGKSESYVQQKLKILEYPDYLYNAVCEKLISFSSARELIRITDEIVLREYVGFAINSGITPAIAKQWADEYLQRMAIKNMDEDEARESLPDGNIEEPRFLCQSCGQAKKASETMLYRLCVDIESCEKHKEANTK